MIGKQISEQVMINERWLRVLLAINKKPRGAQEISRLTEIPIAAMYRVLHAMVEEKLIVEHDRVLTGKGKRMTLYYSHFKRLIVNITNNRLEVQVKLNTGLVKIADIVLEEKLVWNEMMFRKE